MVTNLDFERLFAYMLDYGGGVVTLHLWSPQVKTQSKSLGVSCKVLTTSLLFNLRRGSMQKSSRASEAP
jgi:hypothetical protein